MARTAIHLQSKTAQHLDAGVAAFTHTVKCEESRAVTLISSDPISKMALTAAMRT
jgi:hypothetical protein